MTVGEVRWAEAVEALSSEYEILTEVIGNLGSTDLERLSGCAGWSNADLVYHLQHDAHRALVTFHSPVSGPATTTYVEYWRGYQAMNHRAKRHAEFVKEVVAAHSDITFVPPWWLKAAPAAVRAARATEDLGHVTTQGHVFRVADFIATLVVEATVHHLDLTIDPEPRPAQRAVALTVKTLDGLLGEPRPEWWDDLTFIRKATGRAELDRPDLAAMAKTAQRFPLFS
jgi:hypothetical protein